MTSIPIHFSRQILPDTFEYSLNHLIDHELDLSIFDERFKNGMTGATAYDLRILLNRALSLLSGHRLSRKIEQTCREDIIFMALSADSRPHTEENIKILHRKKRNLPIRSTS